MTRFACAAASEERGEPMPGTASTVRSFLLVEHAGPWGAVALRDARLPDGLGAHLADEAARTRVRVLLVRRPGRRPDDATGTRVFGARVAGASSWLETTTLDRIDDVRGLDLDALGAGRSLGLERSEEPVLAVCTHGRHDACCAERGRPVALALAGTAYADAVWECSHIGGDRFAGNLLVLPRGLYYGRVDPASALDVAAATAAGEVVPALLRGRSDAAMPVQAAEVEVRRRLGLAAYDAVRATTARRDGDLTTVTLDAAGTTVQMEVRRVLDPEQQLTCAATRLSPVPRWEVRPVSPAGP